MRFLAACLLLLACPLSAAEAPRLPADLKITDNIVFKEAGGTKLELMLFAPLERVFEKSPLVVYIHGGGWGRGDRYKVLRADVVNVVRGLNKRGITCASIEYRLADGGEAKAMDCVADCKDAVRYLVAHAAEHGIDPRRIGTFGSSAGGHLTLVTALGREGDYPCALPAPAAEAFKVCCVAAYYPLVSFEDAELMKGSNFERPQRMLPLLGGLAQEKPDLARKLSPVTMLRAGGPAVFVAHGDKDRVLSFQNAVALRAAAEKAGVPVECVISKGADHGFAGTAISPTIAEINERTVAFFIQWLARQGE